MIHQSAFLIELGSITSEECSIRIAAEGFFEVEILLSIWDRGPVSVACAVVEWKLQIFYSIGLEVITSPQPSSDLSTQVVSDGFRSSGIDQVSVARVESNVSLSVQLKNEDSFRYLKTIFIITYDGVASGIGSLFVTSWKIIETLLGHISSKDVSDFSLISCFLESIGKSSDPGEFSVRSQVLEEDCALVSITEENWFNFCKWKFSNLLFGNTFVSTSFSGTKLWLTNCDNTGDDHKRFHCLEWLCKLLSK